MTQDSPSNPLLSMRGIQKRFGSTVALDNVSLGVLRGEVHALIGENGAGKSTLMKILSGALQPDAGEITIDGAPHRYGSPREARANGVAMIYQELTLAPQLTVAANMMLGREEHVAGFARDPRDKMREALKRLGHGHIDLDMRVGLLGVGEQQIVEIARALMTRARIIIMDEPTSSLSSRDTEALFAAIRGLTAEGVTVVYISHFLEEVSSIADRYTVLRDGRSVATGEMKGTGLAEIIRHMVGRTLEDLFPAVAHECGDTVLSVRSLTRGNEVRDVSFELRAGEILGIAGLIGSGRTEMARSIFGLDQAESGTVKIRGKELGARTPRTCLNNGIAFISEDRKEEGLALNLPLRENVTLPRLHQFVTPMTPGIIDAGREVRAVKIHCDRLAVKRASDMQKAQSLSGGNQQKILFARVLVGQSDILILDEPTRGIDVGSKSQIYRLIGELAAEGKAIIMISSYLPELFGVCDSIAVMYRGALSPVYPANQWNEEKVMTWATSGRMAA
jgi:ribose transport system ATP-binding protein